MTSKMRQLTDDDHEQMDAFLARVLDAYRTGKIDRSGAIADIAHVIAALDINNIGEVRSYFTNYSK
jgi:hypothetical protein